MSTAVTPLIRLLRRPSLNEHPPGKLTVWRWIGWICLMVLAASVAGQLVGLLAHWSGWNIAPGGLGDYIVSHVSMSVAVLVLLAPILEELGFRAFLSTEPKLVFVGLAFFLTYLYIGAHVTLTNVPVASAVHQYFQMYLALLPAGAVSFLLYRYYREPVLRFFRLHGAWVFWTSCIVFGALHERTDSGVLVWWGFVLVLPQFVLGVGLAYLRVNFGLRWSIATHMAFDWTIIFGVWIYSVTPVDSPIKVAMPWLAGGLGALAVIYGLVVSWRVVRVRW